ncbi:GNAT family N-acetyltransferase [Agreia sp. COWG]|uniref:GNAT family N-acetyltransferase n=1 Tax=Agreia sp. COWG TaxID=2773266 RepID=UPI001928903C|nr:GNAT family N-acetyltransferase [Agreia sp. COWG]
MRIDTLTSSRLLLDQPGDADIGAITEACQDAVFERFMTLPWPYRQSDAQYFVRHLVPEGWADGDEASWAIRPLDDPGRLLGMISIRSANAELGYWLAPDARGHGYMVEAVDRVVAWAREMHFAGAGTVRWSCVAGNIASAAVARRAGFRYVGEGPSTVAMRDGSRPLSWFGEHLLPGGTPSGDGARAIDSWPPRTLSFRV